MSSEELYHYGIPNMKWGVRRYQNRDGSLTKEGIERYRTNKESHDEYGFNKYNPYVHPIKYRKGENAKKTVEWLGSNEKFIKRYRKHLGVDTKKFEKNKKILDTGANDLNDPDEWEAQAKKTAKKLGYSKRMIKDLLDRGGDEEFNNLVVVNYLKSDPAYKRAYSMVNDAVAKFKDVPYGEYLSSIDYGYINGDSDNDFD